MQFLYLIQRDLLRPLLDLFNPKKNALLAHSRSIIARVNGILHEIKESIALGINDVTLHCIDANHYLWKKVWLP